MPERIVPMIHVPDVKTTMGWYSSIGFVVQRTGEENGEVVWASLTYGQNEIMLDSGGSTSSEPRREFDLYIYTDRVDQLHAQLKDRVTVVEDLGDTFYGMREFIIQDNNGFWLTFGQPVPS